MFYTWAVACQLDSEDCKQSFVSFGLSLSVLKSLNEFFTFLYRLRRGLPTWFDVKASLVIVQHPSPVAGSATGDKADINGTSKRAIISRLGYLRKETETETVYFNTAAADMMSR